MFGILTVLVTVAWAPLAEADNAVLVAARGLTARNGWLDATFSVVSAVLSPWVFRLTAAVAALLLAATAHWRAPTPHHRALRRRLALFVLVTVAVGGLLSAGWKVAVGRDRPAAALALADAHGMSYPSGHAIGAAVAVVVMLSVVAVTRRRRPRMFLYTTGLLLVATVGLSRLALGVHYLSDVVGGCLLGLAWATGAAAVTLGRRRQPVDRRQPADRRSC